MSSQPPPPTSASASAPTSSAPQRRERDEPAPRDSNQHQRPKAQQQQQQEHANVVPPHKVGRLVMYEQNVPGYDAIMQRHDCSQLQDAIKCALRERNVFAGRRGGVVRITDLGCGTGRSTKLVVNAIMDLFREQNQQNQQNQYQQQEPEEQPELIFHICGVDKSAAMAAEYQSIVSRFLTSLPSSRGVHSFPVDENLSQQQQQEQQQRQEEQEEHNLLQQHIVWAGVASLEDFSSRQLEARFQPAAEIAADVVICAWALSHVMSAQWGGERWHATVKRCVDHMAGSRLLVPGGVALVVETLGTDTETPTRRSALVPFLEDECAMLVRPPIVVRTDYKFASRDEGERMSRFFFGDAMRQKFVARCDAAAAAGAAGGGAESGGSGDFVLPECTGVWIKQNLPAATAASAGAGEGAAAGAA